MRIHPRRTLPYFMLGAFGIVFLMTIQRNTHIQDNLDPPFLDNPPGAHVFNQVTFHREVRQTTLHQFWNHSNDIHNSLWHHGSDPHNDRIIAQMAHVPKWYTNSVAIKTIYVPGGIWDTPLGQTKFLEQECPVNRCRLTTHSPRTADAVLIQNSQDGANIPKLPGQIWILWLLESPLNSISLRWLHNWVNWTASYRSDSTIVTPYEKFVPFSNISSLPDIPFMNYAEGKTKLVAWFVSNCNSVNRRLQYAHELARHIIVDIFGACGKNRCSRGPPHGKCDKLLAKDYKFYLSFENSNCAYYITEKLFWNALFNDIVPVVMGARKADYLAAAPPHSFIHIEDFSTAKDLADYLLKLDQNDHLFNEYFRWKNTGSFINTKFWCRMCAMLHDVDKPVTWFDDVEAWWRPNGTCTRDKWSKETDVIKNMAPYVIN